MIAAPDLIGKAVFGSLQGAVFPSLADFGGQGCLETFNKRTPFGSGPGKTDPQGKFGDAPEDVSNAMLELAKSLALSQLHKK